MPIRKFVDAHNHMAEVWRHSPEQFELWHQMALKSGVYFQMPGGINPENWDAQISLFKAYPQNYGLCFGIHPYTASQLTRAELENMLDLLNTYLISNKKSTYCALGEIGLDFRPYYLEKGSDSQITAFESQLEMAHFHQLPIVIHIVKAHDDAKKIFSLWGNNLTKGLVHSFSGTWQQAQFWINKGFYISLGGPVTWSKNKKAKEIAKLIPLDSLILETDSPDQSPEGIPQAGNSPSMLWTVAKTIGEIRGLDAERVLELSTNNINLLIGRN